MNQEINIIPEVLQATYEKYKTQFDVILKEISVDLREKEKERIVSDLLSVTNDSEIRAGEYFMYDFAHKTRAEQSEFFTEKSTKEMFYRFNDNNSLNYNTRDKWKVYEHLKSYYHREICLVTGLEHRDVLFSLLKEKKRLFCKPLCGSLGEKTKIIKDTDFLTDEAFKNLIEYYSPEGFLAEEMIQQCEFMMRLNPTSVNTLRIMTIRMDNRICMYFESRIGLMFSIVDNLGWGSLICGIDEKDGTIISAFNKNRTLYKTHPHTRAQIIGSKIPRFNEAIELVKELARYFPGYRYLSWDLALTNIGWVIVELNGKGGICGFQQVYNCGIRRDIENYLNELNKPIAFTGLLNEGYIPLSKGKMCPHAEYPFSL